MRHPLPPLSSAQGTAIRRTDHVGQRAAVPNTRLPYSVGRSWRGSEPAVVYCGNDGPPGTLVAQLEECLASGAPFGVLVLEGNVANEGSLRTAMQAIGRDRLATACIGWAVIVPRADVRPALLAHNARAATRDGADAPFPVCACADKAEAMAWLRRRLGG
jgi:hypothetical protein